jgi:polysaccharide pyruvyl transferase WcaK-like protein
LVTGDRGDRTALDDLIARVSAEVTVPPGRLAGEPSETLHELMEQLQDCDLVVATRFHNLVCALKLAKPVISLGYAAKNDALLGEMGMAEFCHRVEDFDPERVIRQIGTMMTERERHAARIRAVIADYQERLRDQHEALGRSLRLARIAPGRNTVPLTEV